MASPQKRAQAARDADADKQLAKGKTSLWGRGKSSRAEAKPENAGLGRREIAALEAENDKGHIGRGRSAVVRRGQQARGSKP
jgi:hypothetical protein